MNACQDSHVDFQLSEHQGYAGALWGDPHTGEQCLPIKPRSVFEISMGGSELCI